MDAASGYVLFALVDVVHQVKLVEKLLVVAYIKKHIGRASVLSDDNRAIRPTCLRHQMRNIRPERRERYNILCIINL